MNEVDWLGLALIVAVALLPVAVWFGTEIGRLQERDAQRNAGRIPQQRGGS